jgi:hypothetical protein
MILLPELHTIFGYIRNLLLFTMSEREEGAMLRLISIYLEVMFLLFLIKFIIFGLIFNFSVSFFFLKKKKITNPPN